MTNQVNQAFEKWWYGTDANLILCSRNSAEVGYQAATKASEQRIQGLEAEIANLHTVMMAAAVEITERWEAHCDEDGCGPANLVRRLENGYPEQYGYDAKTMVRMDKQIDELTESNNKLREALEELLPAYRKAVKLYDSNHDDAYTVKAHNVLAKTRSIK